MYSKGLWLLNSSMLKFVDTDLIKDAQIFCIWQCISRWYLGSCYWSRRRATQGFPPTGMLWLSSMWPVLPFISIHQPSKGYETICKISSSIAFLAFSLLNSMRKHLPSSPALALINDKNYTWMDKMFWTLLKKMIPFESQSYWFGEEVILNVFSSTLWQSQQVVNYYFKLLM